MLTTPLFYGCWLSLNTGKASCEIPDRLMAIPIPPLIILFSVLHVRNNGSSQMNSSIEILMYHKENTFSNEDK